MQVLSLSAEVLLQCRAPTVPDPPSQPGLRVSGTYFNCIMFMVASSVVTTIMVLNYHHRHKETHAMPGWVQTLFLQYLPWLLMMSRPGKRITRKTIMMQRKLKELDRSGCGERNISLLRAC